MKHIVLSLALLAIGVPVLAQTQPPLSFETKLDVKTGIRSIENIIVKRDAGFKSFGPQHK